MENPDSGLWKIVGAELKKEGMDAEGMDQQIKKLSSAAYHLLRWMKFCTS